MNQCTTNKRLKRVSFKILEQIHKEYSGPMACAPSEDSDQPGHPPSLIRVFAVHMKKAWVLSYSLRAQRRLWSDWADAQADLSLPWAHMSFCWFCRALAEMCVRSFASSVKHHNKTQIITKLQWNKVEGINRKLKPEQKKNTSWTMIKSFFSNKTKTNL